MQDLDMEVSALCGDKVYRRSHGLLFLVPHELPVFSCCPGEKSPHLPTQPLQTHTHTKGERKKKEEEEEEEEEEEKKEGDGEGEGKGVGEGRRRRRKAKIEFFDRLVLQ